MRNAASSTARALSGELPPLGYAAVHDRLVCLHHCAVALGARVCVL